MEQSEALLVTIVCANRAEAGQIGRALVEARFAACCNIFDHDAIFRWNGFVTEAKETTLLVKTTARCFNSLCELVRSRHSYSLPCIVGQKVTKGYPPFLAWVDAETMPSQP